MAKVNIKPISDLNRYSDVLKEVSKGSPVYLTKNGYGKYVIYSIDDPFIELAGQLIVDDAFVNQISEAHKKAEEEGWLTLDEVREELKKKKK